jgi:hypothetical protein
MHIPDHAAADKDILDAAQMRIAQFVQNRDIIELDVEILVDRFQGAADRDVVLEFYGYCCVVGGLALVVFFCEGRDWELLLRMGRKPTVVCEGLEETAQIELVCMVGSSLWVVGEGV